VPCNSYLCSTHCLDLATKNNMNIPNYVCLGSHVMFWDTKDRAETYLSRSQISPMQPGTPGVIFDYRLDWDTEVLETPACPAGPLCSTASMLYARAHDGKEMRDSDFFSRKCISQNWRAGEKRTFPKGETQETQAIHWISKE
jgi:hypothetical protein